MEYTTNYIHSCGILRKMLVDSGWLIFFRNNLTIYKEVYIYIIEGDLCPVAC